MIPLQPLSRIAFTARPSGAIDHSAMERTDDRRTATHDIARDADPRGHAG
jgi:hypothetical protein